MTTIERKTTVHRKVKSAMSWAVAESLLSVGFSFLTTLVAARYVEPRDFGLVVIALAIASMVQAVLLTGPTNAIIRSAEMDPRTSDSVFWAMIALGTLSAVFCALIAMPVAVFYGSHALVPLVASAGILCLIESISSVPGALLSRKMRTRALTLRTLWQKASTLVVTGVLAILGFGAWAVLGGAICGACCGALVLLCRSRRLPKIRFDLKDCWPIFSTGSAIAVELLAGALTPRVAVLLFGRFHGVESLGYLNFAVRLVDEIGNLLKNTVARTALPLFGLIRRHGGSDLEAFATGTRLICAISTPALSGLAAISPDLVPFVFGTKWTEAVYAVQIVAVASCLMFTRSLMPPLLLTRGSQVPQIVNSWLAFATAIIAAYVFADIPYPYSAWAYVMPTLVTIPSGLLLGWRICQISPWFQLRPAIGAVFSGFLMMLAIRHMSDFLLVDLTTAARIIVQIATGCSWHILYLVIFDRSTVRQVKSLLKAG